jgi:SAM-dependent methyltransferase
MVRWSTWGPRENWRWRVEPDFSRTVTDYAAYRPAFPEGLFRRLTALGVGLPGQMVLDLGAGTGLMGRKLLERGCRVVFVDPSAELLGQSDGTQVQGRAEAIPFSDAVFDAVVVAQAWHWFDRAKAPREVRRVLKDGGRVAAAYQMPVPALGSVAWRTEQLILKHNPSWRHANSAGINGQVLRDFQAAGLVGIESFSFDLPVPMTRPQWRGFTRTSSAVGATMTESQIASFDRDHEQLLQTEAEPVQILFRVFAAVAAKPASGL